MSAFSSEGWLLKSPVISLQSCLNSLDFRNSIELSSIRCLLERLYLTLLSVPEGTTLGKGQLPLILQWQTASVLKEPSEFSIQESVLLSKLATNLSSLRFVV